MPVSERTIAEMAEGARQLRVNSGHAGALPDGYLDEIIRTQQRMAQLKAWEAAGRIRIEYAMRYHTSDKSVMRTETTIVYVRLPDRSEQAFSDQHAQEIGAWPSEVLLANIAICLMANEGKPYDPAT